MKALLATPELLRTSCYLNGQWIGENHSPRIEVKNPATGAIVGNVPSFGYDETMQAIADAHSAWGGWRKLLAKERSDRLLEWSRLIKQHVDDIAIIMTQELGKPISQSRGEVEYATSFIDWYAHEGQRIHGETVQATKSGRRETVWKEPVGVSAAITPWNFPAAMITRKVAPALAAGCPVVLKPAEKTPLTALALAYCAEQAGIPAGILNVITGKASEIGRAMTESKTVRKLSFTGSTAVGKKLYAQCADSVKKLSLELGGNAPFIIFEDADLDAALAGLDIAKFRNTGQTCVCANRIFIHDSVYDTFRDKLRAHVDSLIVGDPMDEKTQIGCLVDTHAFDAVHDTLQHALSQGATLLTGGSTPEGLSSPFLAPTIIENATNDMMICQEEVFSPVATLMRFSSDEEVIRTANDTQYGLAAYFYTQDYKRIIRVGEALEYGMVGANLGHVSSVTSPFGGYKESGIGREASSYGIEEFLETKYLAIGEIES